MFLPREALGMMEWPPRYSPGFIPEANSEYWDPEPETMPPEQRDLIILEKLRSQVRYAFVNSGFYREFYRDAPVDPTNISSFEELARLPILTKEEVRREQELYPPYGRFLCIPEQEVFRVHGTSGTTGRPTVFGIGRDDWGRIGEAHARILWAAGLRPGDIVMVAAVFSLYIGSWGALVGAERLGATCFPFGSGAPGQTERAAEWAAMLKPSALYATPSYALYLAEVAKSMGLDPRTDFGFRFMFFSGEPGASVPSTRSQIEDTYDCYVVDMGTMAEMTPWMTNAGCRHLDQGMHLWNDLVYTEMVDPNSKAPLPLGAEGVPVYTHLERTSQPMIRYWSGDIARWDMVDCPCGRTYPTLTLGIYGRTDDMIIVRGQNVFPSRIEDILRGMKEFGGEFRLVLERESGQLDRLTVQTEVNAESYSDREYDPAALEPLRERIAADLRRAIGVGVAVELKPAGEFERTQFKARRIIDRRRDRRQI
jgi:phenylacetate-CoA ligase